jgi:hypothetical protein
MVVGLNRQEASKQRNLTYAQVFFYQAKIIRFSWTTTLFSSM